MLEFLASFRVTGRDVDPEEVSALMGLTPTTSYRRGDPHIGKRGRYADRSEGLWALESPLKEAGSLRDHMHYLIGKLKDKEKSLAELRCRGYHVELFIGVFEIGDGDELTLSASELSDLAALQIDVGFDLYTFNDPEVDLNDKLI